MSVNVDILKDPTNDDFFGELDYAVRKLKAKDASRVFRTLIRILGEGNTEDVEKAVANTIYQLLLRPELREIFVNKGYLLHIPFDSSYIREDLFNILYILATWSPTVFDENLAESFRILIRKNPAKALRIISVLAQHYPLASANYPILDQLIGGKAYFSREETAAQYASLIGYLCGVSMTFTEARKKYLHPILQGLLSSQDKSIVKAALSALGEIANRDPSYGVPLDFIVERITDEELQQPLANLMMVCNIPEAAYQIEESVIDVLLEAALNTPDILYALVKLAENTSVAYSLMKKMDWISDPSLPLDSRLRLFEAIFFHSRVRHHIAEYDQFYCFLQEAVSVALPDYLAIVCATIRRIRIDDEVIQQLQEYTVLQTFFNSASQISTKETYHDAICLVDVTLDFGFYDDLIPACKLVKKIATEGKYRLGELLQFILKLCDFEQCLRSFRELRISKQLNSAKDRDQYSDLLEKVQMKLNSPE